MGQTSWTFWLKRLLILIPTILANITLVFVVLRVIPGDPVLIMLGENATGEEYDQLAHELGLDQPIHIQYFVYLTRILRGDWGKSAISHDAVLPYVLRKFEATLELTTVAMILSSIMGISLGTLAALKKGTSIDKICRVVSLFGFSTPIFWFGLIVMLVFAVYLNVLPPLGRSVVLPAVTLGLWSSGTITQITRASVLNVIEQDFVTTAIAKGVSYRRLVINHILKNASLPIATTIGLQFGRLLGGAAVVESVFNFPGVGLLIVNGVFRRDYPVVQGGILLVSISICLAVILIDVVYTFLDPRITMR